MRGRAALVRPPTTAYSNTYLEDALAQVKEVKDVKGSGFQPLTVTPKEGGKRPMPASETDTTHTLRALLRE